MYRRQSITFALRNRPLGKLKTAAKDLKVPNDLQLTQAFKQVEFEAFC